MIGLFNEPEKDNGKKTTKNGEGYLNLPKQQGYIENLLWRDKNSKNDTIQINYTKPKNGYIQNLMKNNIPGWKGKEKNKIFQTHKPDKTRVSMNNYYIDKEKDFGFRPFGGNSYQYSLTEGYGLSGTIQLSGFVAKKGDSISLIVNSRNRPEYEMYGDVEVLVNGKTASRTKLVPDKNGYVYRKGAPKSLGVATVKLPPQGKIEIWANGSGLLNDGTGRNANNVSEKVFSIDKW